MKKNKEIKLRQGDIWKVPGSEKRRVILEVDSKTDWLIIYEPFTITYPDGEWGLSAFNSTISNFKNWIKRTGARLQKGENAVQ